MWIDSITSASPDHTACPNRFVGAARELGACLAGLFVSRLASLRHVHLYGDGLRREVLEALDAYRECRLTRLEIPRTHSKSRSLLEGLGTCSLDRLQVLDISGTGLQDRHVFVLCTLGAVHLRSLYAQDNQLTCKGLWHMAWPGLTHLDVRGNTTLFEDSKGVEVLRGFAVLERFDVAETGMGRSSVHALMREVQSLKGLRVLRVSSPSRDYADTMGLLHQTEHIAQVELGSSALTLEQMELLMGRFPKLKGIDNGRDFRTKRGPS